MISESKGHGRRNTALAAVIGSVLAAYAGSASALEFESDNGVRVNWNTTISVGSSWRAEDPSKLLYSYGDGALIGKYTGNYVPGTVVAKGNGLAGNWAAGGATLNYDKGDRFSTPFKLITDVEIKKGRFGALVRAKAWYDQALNENEVKVGNQANFLNGTRVLGPTAPNCSSVSPTITQCIPLSTPGNNVWPKAKLSDDGFEDEQKFDNVYLLDAYVYGSFTVGNSDLQVRLGNQVVNWGESVFIQGVNQINPIDVPAARRAGAELKEILLPVWMAYINWGLPFGSLEAFYQLQWNNTSIDGCGTYWSQTDSIISTRPGNCNSSTAFGPVLASTLAQFGSAAFYQAVGSYVPLGKGKEASDSGQFGVAFRFPVDAIDTEIGLYAMNIHSRLPVVSSHQGTAPSGLSPAEQAILGNPAVNLWSANCGALFANGPCYKAGTTSVTAAIPAIAAGAAAAGAAFNVPINLTPPNSLWEYPEDIQVYGVSTASNLFGWSVSSELSYHKDVPVQINGNDLLLGAFLLMGPNREASLAAYQKGSGAYQPGFDRFDKTQFQVNTVKTYSNLLGSDNMLIIGEVGMQWNNVPDHMKDNVRYGRGFMWGYGSSPSYGITLPLTGGSTCSPTFVNAPTVPAGSFYNPSPRGCKNDGFVTDTAWGYRLRVSADYLNVFNTGVAVTPSVFWSQDVDGVSMDPAFIEDRSVLGLGVKFTYNKKYVLDLNYVTYGNSGFDPLQDRDYYSAAVSVTF